MWGKTTSLIAIIAAWGWSSALANDTVATITPEGLRIKESGDIRMLEENLSISPHWIGVSYIFMNDSDRDITTEVAFPLPPIEAGDKDDETFLKHNIIPRNTFDNFQVFVDGKKVAYKTDIRATIDGKDVTQKVVTTGLTLGEPHDADKISANLLAQAKKNGLYEYSELWEAWRPTYDLSITYHWTQRFPAHQKVWVRHIYMPVLGFNSIDALNHEEVWKSLCSKEAKEARAGCLFANSKDDGTGSARYAAAYLRYILSTGANWKNGIEKLSLSMSGSNVIFYQMDGQANVSLGDVRIERANYRPKDELLVEFVDDMPWKMPKVFGGLHKAVSKDTLCFINDERRGDSVLIPRGETVSILERQHFTGSYFISYKDRSCWIDSADMGERSYIE